MSSGMHDLQRRIKTVQSTHKVTSAMRTVAAAKYNRARVQAENFAPYRDACLKLLADVGIEYEAAPSAGRPCYLAVTANRGLCGSYNEDLMRSLCDRLDKEKGDYCVIICGRWGCDHFSSFGIKNVVKTFYLSDIPTPAEVEKLCAYLRGLYSSGEVGSITAVTQTFKNILNQTPALTRILPPEASPPSVPGKYIFEPDRSAITQQLKDRCLMANVYGLLLSAAEGAHGAMLIAMRQAAESSDTMLRQLERTLNRMRQAAVTTEVIEVSSSAEADNEE